MNNRLEKYTKDMLKKLTLDDLLSLIGEREKPKQSYIYENFVKADFSKTVFAGSFANIVDVKNYGVMCCINDGFIALNCYPYKA
ncbi:MAG: hypothetical protein N3A54_07070, partial [Patescibacteria group bacterium]|nr:hypothetical protein [Patescibacteria group bacterium]